MSNCGPAKSDALRSVLVQSSWSWLALANRVICKTGPERIMSSTYGACSFFFCQSLLEKPSFKVQWSAALWSEICDHGVGAGESGYNVSFIPSLPLTIEKWFSRLIEMRLERFQETKFRRFLESHRIHFLFSSVFAPFKKTFRCHWIR